MALRAASLGAKVGVVGRTEVKLAETIAAIRDGGGTAALAVADVRDPAHVHAAFDALESALGPLDGLVNNAAGNFLAASEELSPNAFDAVVKIVLYGSFHCTLDFGKRLIGAKRKGGILNIVTTYAWTGSPFVLPSAAAKAGVLAMTRSLAVEWATYGIRVNAIAPGPIPTEGAFAKLMPPGVEEMAKARVPLRRFGTPEELADLAVYLLSDGSAYITGDCITMDGGEWLQSGAEFGTFTQMDRAAIKQMFGAMRPKK
jgi:NAD(P)-dependent dehydrogenase (short-subunit alcohol dehydrogenase family)